MDERRFFSIDRIGQVQKGDLVRVKGTNHTSRVKEVLGSSCKLEEHRKGEYNLYGYWELQKAEYRLPPKPEQLYNLEYMAWIASADPAGTALFAMSAC